jgi:PEP-CTERM motif
MNRKAWFKAGWSVATMCATFTATAATAATAPIAPTCVASLTEPSWADCADVMFRSAPVDGGAASFVDAAGAPLWSTDLTALRGGAEGARRDRSAARVYPLQVVPSIPEPHTLVLMLAGLVAIGFMAMRRRDR